MQKRSLFLLLLLFSGIMTGISVIPARAEVTNANWDYIYTHVDWNNIDTNNYSTWEAQNMSVEFGKNMSGIVLEMKTNNRDYSAEYSGGVRTGGSSLERRYPIDSVGDSLQRCYNDVHWFVTVNQSGYIETWEGQSEVNVQVIGYFNFTNGASFTELFDTIVLGSYDAWTQYNVTANHGVPADSVIILQLGSNRSDTGELVGARNSTSSLNRYMDISGRYDANGQYRQMTLPVQVNGSGFISLYADREYYAFIRIQGYFEGLLFEEAWTDLNPTVAGSWEYEDMSGHNVPANTTIITVFSNDYNSGIDYEIMESDNVGSPSRYGGFSWTQSEDSGHWNPSTMCVDVNETQYFASYVGATIVRNHYAGYFYTEAGAPAPPSAPAYTWGEYIWHGFLIAGIIMMTYSPIHIVKEFKEQSEYEDMVIGLLIGFVVFIIGLGLFYTWITYL